MTTAEKIQAVKNILFFGSVDGQAPAPEATPAEFKEYPLKDGTSLSIDKLEVGGAVQLAGVPAADGEYILADGTSVQVAGGLIVELASPVEDTLPEEMAAPALFAELKEENKGLKSELDELKQEFAKQAKAFEGIVELLTDLKQPVGAPAEQPQNFKNQKADQAPAEKKWEDMTPLERRRAERKAQA